jgi:ATP-dependent 26S proteasome regulatory subunit
MIGTNESLPNGIAGILTLDIALGISFATVVVGESLVYNQLTNPFFSGVLWPIEVLSVGLAVPIGGLFLLVFTLGFISAFTSPQLLHQNEYSVIGVGGLLGTVSAALTSTFHQGMGIGLLGQFHPASAGQSLLALAIVAIPSGYIYSRFWRSLKGGRRASQLFSSETRPDPEAVEKLRRKRPDSPEMVGFQDRSLENSREPHTNKQSQSTDRKITIREDSSTPNLSKNLDLENLEYNWTSETDVSMDDVGGMEDLKKELHRDVVLPLTSEKERAEALGIPVPNIVFYGPPGTGKTYLAKALATELELPFVRLSGNDVQSKWINESPQMIKTLFEEAQTVATNAGGAIVFLDELDAVLKSRDGAGRAHEEDNKVVAEFLTHLQETAEDDILFIGATNRMEVLDEAVIRSGRIDKKIRVGRPDQEARKAILQAQLADRPHALSDEAIEHVAAIMEGLVAADLEALTIEAARYSVFSRGDDTIRWKDLKRVMNTLEEDK